MSLAECNRPCEERIDEHLRDRVSDLRRLWRDYRSGRDCEFLPEYARSFDYVLAETFEDQRQGYFRYQLSLGGPSDAFRFLADPELSFHRVEYWFLDWFDGAHRVPSGAPEKLLLELWDWFRDTDAARAALNNSR